MLVIVEEGGLQLLSESSYVTEYSLLSRMHRDLTPVSYTHLTLPTIYSV